MILKKKTISKGLSSTKKRDCPSEFPKLEECLIKWLHTCGDRHITVDGPLVKEKAKFYVTELNIQDFGASEGWLKKFKRRHDLVV